jgi:prophage tail gpP-like protein
MSNGDTVTLPEIVVKPQPDSGQPTFSPIPFTSSQPTFAQMASPLRPYRPDNAQVPPDVATLIVQGFNFQDWESVWVQLRWGYDSDLFRFTAVERDNPPGMFYRLQFVPGETCQINLGGIDVINGFIETRQVAYDATRHGVELQGRSQTNWPAKSSVNTKSGSFDGMTFTEVVKKVLQPFPVGAITIGTIDETPFDKLQAQKGEMIWDFLERIARPRGVLLSADSFGNFLLIGDHHMPVVNTQLIEGENIKKAQWLFKKEHVWQAYRVDAESAGGSNGISGEQASGDLTATVGGSGQLNSILITPAEQPVKSIAEVLARAKNEWLWHEGTLIEGTVTVQGWFRDKQNIWWPGDNVFVYSPMAPVNMMMKIQSATFTQDNANGTETTLELKQPWALKDSHPFNVDNPGATASTPTQTTVQPIPD